MKTIILIIPYVNHFVKFSNNIVQKNVNKKQQK